MDVYHKTVSDCCVCGEKCLPAIEFESFPLTDILVSAPTISEEVYQAFMLCTKCGHGQLYSQIHPSVLYRSAYSFVTSRSPLLISDDICNYIEYLFDDHKFDTIIDVGCNDCYLLNKLRSRANCLIGIDPVLKGREDEFNDDQLKVFGSAIEDVKLDVYNNSLFISSHCFEHLENPYRVLEGLVACAGNNSTFIVQVPEFGVLLDGGRFDQIYNHHLHYFSLSSFNKMLQLLSCEVIDYHIDQHYWGSMTIAFRKFTGRAGIVVDAPTHNQSTVMFDYDMFKKRMRLLTIYLTFSKDKKFGYGAALQLPVLAYHLHNDFSDFECIIDDDPNRDGLYYMNLPVQIKNINNAGTLKDSIILITANNFSRSIVPKLLPQNPKRIILPFGYM